MERIEQEGKISVMKKLGFFIFLILQEIVIIAIAFLYYDYAKAKERIEELEQEPYFTEEKLTAEEYELVLDCIKIPSWPSWEERWYLPNWPDYSYYMFGLGTPETDKQLTVLNYLLFIKNDGTNKEAIQKAGECALSLQFPMKDRWIMNNTRNTVEILEAMDDGGKCLKNDEFVAETIQVFFEECEVVSIPRKVMIDSSKDILQNISIGGEGVEE